MHGYSPVSDFLGWPMRYILSILYTSIQYREDASRGTSSPTRRKKVRNLSDSELNIGGKGENNLQRFRGNQQSARM